MEVGAHVAALVLAVLGLACVVPSVLTANVRAADASAYAVVDGCGSQDRLCVAYPTGCTATSTCTLVVTARQDPDDATKYRFEMAAKYTAYVAVALAKAGTMGNDSVVECMVDPDPKQNNKVVLFQSVNSDRKPQTKRRGNTRLGPEAQVGVSLKTGAIVNGVVSCTFTRDQRTTVNGTDYDLATGSWYIQGAAGSRLNADSSIHHHDEYVVSSQSVRLSAVGLQDSYGERKQHSGAAAAAGGAVLVIALTALSLQSAPAL